MKAIPTLLAVTLLFLTGCFGVTARDRALLPAAQLAWSGVRADAVVGEAETIHLVQIDEALRDGNRLELLAPWTLVKPKALLGVETKFVTGQLGPTGAQLSYERIDNFDEAIQKLSER